MLQDGVLDGAKLAVGVADPLADHIAVFLQLPHPGADTVNAILADPGQPLGGIVPLLRQGEHEGEKALILTDLVDAVLVGDELALDVLTLQRAAQQGGEKSGR